MACEFCKAEDHYAIDCMDSVDDVSGPVYIKDFIDRLIYRQSYPAQWRDSGGEILTNCNLFVCINWHVWHSKRLSPDLCKRCPPTIGQWKYRVQNGILLDLSGRVMRVHMRLKNAQGTEIRLSQREATGKKRGPKPRPKSNVYVPPANTRYSPLGIKLKSQFNTGRRRRKRDEEA